MSQFNFLQVLENVNRTKQELPKLLANQAQNYFVGGFKKGGLGENNWAEVQRRIKGTPEYKYAKPKSNRTKPILVNTGNLRRQVANSVVVAEWVKILLVIQAPYAKYLQNGTSHMKARPFIGQTPKLTEMQFKMIDKFFNLVWHK